MSPDSLSISTPRFLEFRFPLFLASSFDTTGSRAEKGIGLDGMCTSNRAKGEEGKMRDETQGKVKDLRSNQYIGTLRTVVMSDPTEVPDD